MNPVTMTRATESFPSCATKALVLSTLLAVLERSAFAQGAVYFDNGTPSNLNPSATSGGAFFDGFTTPASPVVLTDGVIDYHGSLWGGSSSSTLRLLVSDALMDYSGALGRYLDDSGFAYNVPGVPPATLGYFQIEIWRGDATTLAAAQAAGEPWAISAVFQNLAGNSVIENGPVYLSGMPAVILTIPEPGVFALSGLGSLAWALFVRQRRSTPDAV